MRFSIKGNRTTDTFVQMSSVVFPLLLFAYGILLGLDSVKRVPFGGRLTYYSLALVWISFGLLVLVWPAQTTNKKFSRLIVYHLLAAAYLLLVVGVASPFTGSWALFMLAAFAYAGLRGWLTSALGLCITSFVDAFFITPENTLNIITTTFVTLIVGAVVAVVANQYNFYRSALGVSREQVTLQHDRILTIVNNLAAAIIATDRNGRIQLYNAASLDLLDTNTSPRGKKIDSIIQLFDTDRRSVSLLGLLQAATGVQVREDLQTKISGEVINLSITFSPIHTPSDASSSDDGYVLILRDITKQKSLEEERDEFISVVSHELRTPLTAAEGALSNIQFMIQRNTVPPDVLTNHLRGAYEQVIFLAKMVNDLSTLARAERGTADTPELINVRSFTSELYRQYQPQAYKKGIRFNLELSPSPGYIEVSALYLRELLQNIITNAIKYTKTGSIDLIAQKKNGKVLFAVRDSGIGIRKADQVHVFERFWRSEDYRTRETGGTGLGLYVAAKLAKRLGTRIELKSRLNHGSTFFFILPAVDANSQHVTTEKPKAKSPNLTRLQ